MYLNLCLVTHELKAWELELLCLFVVPSSYFLNRLHGGLALIKFTKSQVQVLQPLVAVQFSTQFVIELCCNIESYLLQSVIFVNRVSFACLHSYLKDLTHSIISLTTNKEYFFRNKELKWYLVIHLLVVLDNV